jgi:integrase
MPRLTQSLPKYRKHRASGQAIVTLNGRDHYLGPHGTAASRREYDRLIAEWMANGRHAPLAASDLQVVEMTARYWKFAAGYYATSEDTNGELGALKQAITALNALYGTTNASDFRPLALKALRDRMIARGWCRGYVNAQVKRVRRMFRWGVENELVPSHLSHGLAAVAPLRCGKTEARESEAVKPVPEAHVDATLNHVAPQVKAMIKIQLLTGMRPGEVCKMRGCDLDTAGRLWVYKPETHKTAYKGHRREIYIGPKAQEFIATFLRPNMQEYLFQPAEAEAHRRQQATERRKTPAGYGNAPGTNRKRHGQRKAGQRYTVSSYRRAIQYGCVKACAMPAELRRQPLAPEATEAERIEHEKREQDRAVKRAAWRADHVWHPHQLRHSAATKFRKEFGLEAAQVLLGHRTLTITQVYAEKNVEAAQAVMAQVG